MASNLTIPSSQHHGGQQEPLSVCPWGQVSLIAIIFYITLCSYCRFQRINKLCRQYPYPDRASLARMTNEHAQIIVHNLSSYEFPYFYDLSQRYALFRVGRDHPRLPPPYPIEYEDTEIIFVCLANFAPTSPILHKAIARMNYLHAQYIKSGRILNEDLLYVLYTAMSEPERFMRDLIEINYEAELGKNQWRDAIEFLDDVSTWASKYEEKYMRPTDEVERLGAALMDLLLSAYPKALRPLGYQIVMVLLGARMRHAFRFPEPGIAVSALTYTLLLGRRLFLRYLSLPRFSRAVFVTEPDPKTGRMRHPHYLKEPWYTPATVWWRWGPTAWATWATGGLVPGDNAEMQPEGFLWEDIGPRNKMGRGVEEMAKMEEHVRQRATGKCPFAISSTS
ncbi:hypothetical protein ED733_004262 [Metarhizium rileyi]|uniref:ER-bound oxygenase mpaB/mpaB'/Rubber oxygenase catalytic domain-containing protein n=1 Tax=Metarhizium rileyi (strain RCEF 4871) TaxID=1649241 RepID=A0A5C6GFY8_METRR|nr:hypothetical protein ED733_004262 [Metarhizium rileyi]